MQDRVARRESRIQYILDHLEREAVRRRFNKYKNVTFNLSRKNRALNVLQTVVERQIKRLRFIQYRQRSKLLTRQVRNEFVVERSGINRDTATIRSVFKDWQH